MMTKEKDFKLELFLHERKKKASLGFNDDELIEKIHGVYAKLTGEYQQLEDWTQNSKEFPTSLSKLQSIVGHMSTDEEVYGTLQTIMTDAIYDSLEDNERVRIIEEAEIRSLCMDAANDILGTLRENYGSV